MVEDSTKTVDGRGRPRRFDDRTERRRLLDAAMTLMIHHGYSAITVTDVLEASGLSTRSFYRHFESKDALLASLVAREVASVARRLERATAEAGDPVSAIEAWVDAFLDTFFEPDRAERASVFAAADVLATPALAGELAGIRADLCRPLAVALRAGHEASVVTSEAPEVDAACIFGIVTAAVQASPDRRRSRPLVRARVLRFVRPALGIS